MNKRKEQSLPATSGREDKIRQRILAQARESERLAADYEATLDPRQKPNSDYHNSNLGNPDPQSQPWASNNANACHSKP